MIVFRQSGAGPTFLQLRRAREESLIDSLAGTWQPVMGHIEEGESAAQAAVRELREETGYTPERGVLGLWQLESLNSYFLASHDCVMLCPGFAVEVARDTEPVLASCHDAHRWITPAETDRLVMWPGHRAAIAQVQRDILPPNAPTRQVLRLDPARR